jgi:hypothetical protein
MLPFTDQILTAVYAVLESTPDDAWDAAMLLDLMNEEKERRQLPQNLFLPVVRHALTAMKVHMSPYICCSLLNVSRMVRQLQN